MTQYSMLSVAEANNSVPVIILFLVCVGLQISKLFLLDQAHLISLSLISFWFQKAADFFWNVNIVQEAMKLLFAIGLNFIHEQGWALLVLACPTKSQYSWQLLLCKSLKEIFISRINAIHLATSSTPVTKKTDFFILPLSCGIWR